MQAISLARELEAIAQSGLHFSTDPFDRERYTRIRTLAAEILASNSNLTTTDILNWSKHEFGYATPKVDTRAFILSDSKVLLLRENADDGKWTLPGGWADANETPSEAVVREVREESGYLVKPTRLLSVFDREAQGHQPAFPYHVYKLFFLCEIIGGEPRTTQESSESGFFSQSEIPELSISRVLPQQLERFFDQIATGKLETLFD